MTKLEPQSAQATAFLAGEGDAWFRRNPYNPKECVSDSFNVHLAELVNAGDRILEIGCSDGRRLAAIGQLAGVTCTLTGVDPSRLAIKAGTKTFPELDLRVGTASDTGLEAIFEIVVLGFCLYLCDRDLLFAAVAEADRLLAEGGTLAIIDFDPPYPMKREYHHLNGLWSYKTDYPKFFLASPTFSLIEKHQMREKRGHVKQRFSAKTDRVAMSILVKNSTVAYVTD